MTSPKGLNKATKALKHAKKDIKGTGPAMRRFLKKMARKARRRIE